MKVILTPFAAVLIPAFVISTGLAIYHLIIQKETGEAMTGVLAIIIGVTTAIVFVVEQAVVRNHPALKTIRILEGITIGLLIISWYLMISKVFVVKVADRTDWFVAFYYPGETIPPFKGSILKEDRLTLDGNAVLLLNEDERTTPVLPDATIGKWRDGYINKETEMSIHGRFLTGTIYLPAGKKLTEAEKKIIDDSIRVSLNRVGF